MASLAMHGIQIKRRGNAARMIVGTPPLLQVVAAVLVAVAVYGLLHMQRQGELERWGSPWLIWSVASLVATGILYFWLFHRTLITIKGTNVAVERRPLPLPRPYVVQLDDIRAVDTDVKVITRRDKHGHERESFRFTVQLSLVSDWRPKRLYRTGSESAAVAFRQTVVMMIENARAINSQTAAAR